MINSSCSVTLCSVTSLTCKVMATSKSLSHGLKSVLSSYYKTARFLWTIPTLLWCKKNLQGGLNLWNFQDSANPEANHLNNASVIFGVDKHVRKRWWCVHFRRHGLYRWRRSQERQDSDRKEYEGVTRKLKDFAQKVSAILSSNTRIGLLHIFLFYVVVS